MASNVFPLGGIKGGFCGLTLLDLTLKETALCQCSILPCCPPTREQSNDKTSLKEYFFRLYLGNDLKHNFLEHLKEVIEEKEGLLLEGD